MDVDTDTKTKTIKITAYAHRRLNVVKANLGVKTLSEAIEWLVSNIEGGSK